MRLFIAVRITECIQKKISQHFCELRTHRSFFRFVPAQNMHITIKFLGKTTPDSVVEITERLNAGYKGHDAFPAHIQGVGAFPNIRKPTILYAGITQGRDRLAEIAAVTDCSLDGLLATEKYPYIPHLTAVRVKKLNEQLRLQQFIQQSSKTDFGRVNVCAISLVQSTLNRRGAVYNDIHQWELS